MESPEYDSKNPHGLAPVEHTPVGFSVVSQHVIPARFRDIDGKQHKLLMPLLISLGIALLIVLTVPIDFLYLMILAASTISIGYGIGNKRIEKVRKEITAHPSIQKMAEESGTDADVIGDHLAAFALGQNNVKSIVSGVGVGVFMPLENGYQMFLNMGEWDEDGVYVGPIPLERQSMGVLRADASASV
jgi:hypothetical protein